MLKNIITNRDINCFLSQSVLKYTLIIYDFINCMISLYLHYQKIQRMNIPGSSFAIRQEMRFYLLTYEGKNKTRVRQISLIGMKKIHRNERIFRKL